MPLPISCAAGWAAMAAELGLRARTLSALRWSYGGALARALAQLLIQLGLARLLGPQAYGQATAALLVIGIGWLFADAGLGNALVQKAQIDAADVSQALGWVLLVSGAVAAAVVLAAPLLARWWGDADLVPLLRACALLIPVQALANLPASLMQRRLDMRRLQWLQTSGYVVAYGGLGLALAWAGWGAWALVAAFGLHGGWNLVGGWLIERHGLRPSLRGDAGLRRYGLAVAASNLANWASDNLDRLLIGRLWGTLALGEFALASNLARAPLNLLVGSAQSVAFSSASRLQADLARLRSVYLALLRAALGLAAPLFMLLALHADVLVPLLYGQRWQGAAPIFAVVCAALPALTLVAVTGPLLRAVDAVGLELRAQWPALALMVVGLLWVAGGGLASAIWWVVGAAVLRALLMVHALAGRIALPWRQALAALLPALALAVLAAVASGLCRAGWGAGLAALAVSTLVTGLALLGWGAWLWSARQAPAVN